MIDIKEHLALSFHKSPKGTHYEVTPFNTKYTAIWIVYDRKFDYNLGEKCKCIWGFIRNKDGAYVAPIDSKKPGKVVELSNTRSWTAMPLNLNPLESAFI
jgi:hypothetical protein